MTKTSRKKTPKKSTPSNKEKLPYGGPPDPELDSSGKIKQWSATCRDGQELKIYIEYGCCDKLSPKVVVKKFPQFLKYSYSTFNSAFQNIKKSLNKQVDNRKQVACKYCLLFIASCFLNLFSLEMFFYANYCFQNLSSRS